MATQVIQPSTDGDRKALKPHEIEYNKKVDAFIRKMKDIASDVFSDMKVRQLPDSIDGAKVYGPKSANRAAFNTFHSRLNKAAAVPEKLKKGSTKKAKGDFVGFAVPCYIDPNMARAIGIPEGSTLWPTGGKPIFSAALLSRFFAHRSFALELVHKDDLSVLTADDLMRALFAPYAGRTVDKQGKPVDLNRLTYPQIQQLITHFIEKRNKAKGQAGPVDPNTETGKVLTKTFKDLGESFKALGELKDRVKEAMKKVASAEQDVMAANDLVQRGEISQTLFAQYAQDYQTLVAEKNQLFTAYKAQAGQLGITRV